MVIVIRLTTIIQDRRSLVPRLVFAFISHMRVPCMHMDLSTAVKLASRFRAATTITAENGNLKRCAYLRDVYDSGCEVFLSGARVEPLPICG